MCSIIVAFSYYLVVLPHLEEQHWGYFGHLAGKWYWTFVLAGCTAWGMSGVAWYEFIARRHFGYAMETARL
jgi:hypothetical protein